MIIVAASQEACHCLDVIGCVFHSVAVKDHSEHSLVVAAIARNDKLAKLQAQEACRISDGVCLSCALGNDLKRAVGGGGDSYALNFCKLPSRLLGVRMMAEEGAHHLCFPAFLENLLEIRHG